jgi:MYXO-CTERM domain-containing protein
VAYAQSVTVDEDGSTGVTLTADDPEGAPLTFSVVNPPAHGELTGSPPDLTYWPAADYAGSDSFTFKASAGGDESNAATVSITVTPVNDAPVARAQNVTLDEDGSLGVTLAATDVDGEALTYTVVTGPTHGTLSGAGGSLTYTPFANYHGSDGFTFVANDGTVDSAEATVSITVTPAGEPAKGGCGCGTSGDVAPLGALLMGMLRLQQRRRNG